MADMIRDRSSVLILALLLGALLAGLLLAGCSESGPEIDGVKPTGGPVSTVITVTGDGFGSSRGTLNIGGLSAPVQSWSNKKIVAVVPANLSEGAKPVQVTTSSGSISNRFAFGVTGVTP